MKGAKFKIFIFIIFALYVVLVVQANASRRRSHSRERKHIYPCGHKFYHYYLDDEPAEYGLYAGDYEKGKAAYVGIVDATFVLISGRIQLSPPGIMYDNNAKSNFNNDPSKIWYLYNNPHHKYEWIDSKNGEEVHFGIDYGTETVETRMYVGRVKMTNNTVALGIVISSLGQMFYINKKDVPTSTKSNYQVLTCKSNKPDKNIPIPKPTMTTTPSLSAENECINNWVEYKGDDAPKKYGISVDSNDCENTIYVGRGPIGQGKDTNETNESYYLADNPNYTYYWVDYKGTYPANSVFTRSSSSSFIIPVARAKINGHMQLGNILANEALFAGDDLSAVRYTNFEVLVCDPWPKYQCGQEWKKFAGNDTPSVDGFNIGNYKDDIISYIGRGTCKQINGCDYELGRIQTDPLTASGVYYLDDLTATEKFDKVTAEYLVKNPKYFYKWVASRSGVKVANALELHKEGHRSFYIGVTQINDNVFVGKVRPGEGLYFVDINGKQKTTSSYNVLTCTSSEAANEVYKEKSDESWFGSFGCSLRKNWDFKQWRCVCKDEFKGIFTSSNAKWNEDTCSYSI